MKTLSPAVLLTLWALLVQAPTQDLAPKPAPRAAPAPAGKPAAPREVATHATKGVVKSVSATAMTITRVTGGRRVDSAFQLTPSTQRVGAIAAGVTVEIRYRTEGKQRIATAVSVEAPPQ